MGQDQSNPDRLLPGESSSLGSGDADDVRHWVKVYAELVNFKDKLLEELEVQGRRVSDEGRDEVKADEELLRPEAARLHRRLEFWRSRLRKRAE